ncbi:MAG: glycosyltransferase family 8 protein [Clostridia bacterium]
MNILVTLDSNYIVPLKVMLKSLFLNNPDEKFAIYLMHSNLNHDELNDLNDYIAGHGSQLNIVQVDEDCFTNAPVHLHYTKEMYYRLLAFKFLPQDLDRILYLDPDILVINPIHELYNTNIKGYLYAAAYHDFISINRINKIRLNPYEIKAYYNSGVLLMNLELQRQTIDENEVFQFVERNRSKLIMPDQDVLNALYSRKIKTLDEKLYNYDARYYRYYKFISNRIWDMEHVICNTVILHFCGKKKPWRKDYSGKFHALYKHYQKLAFNW